MKESENEMAGAEALAEKAYGYRVMLRAECEAQNESARKEAVEAFEAGEIGEYFRQNIDYVLGLVVRRMRAMERGSAAVPLPIFDAETIACLLATDTRTDCTYAQLDERLSDADLIALTDAGDPEDRRYADYVEDVETPSSDLQRCLVAALTQYVTAALAYAKFLASSSCVAWAEMLDILQGCGQPLTLPLDDAMAKRFIELEKSAADQLRLDHVMAAVPAYVPAAKTAEGEA